MRALRDTLLTVGLFLAAWFLLNQINFMERWNVEEVTAENERKLGELVLKNVEMSVDRIESDSINEVVYQVASRILEAAELDTSDVRILVHETPVVNAFALPGNTIVINTGLIEFAKTPEELAGVIAHEIGHLELDHISKRLTREVGVTMITTVVTGGGNMEIIGQIAKTLMSTSYSREQERQSDRYAAEKMAEADMDPEEFANILFRFNSKSDLPREVTVISTHPHPAERSKEVLDLAKELEYDTVPIFEESWEELKYVRHSLKETSFPEINIEVESKVSPAEE